MKIKDYIIIVLVIGLSFSAYHLYAKNETKGTGKPCSSTVEGYVSIAFSREIPTSTTAPKIVDNFIEKIESVVTKLKLSDITRDTENYTVFNNSSQESAVEGNESKVTAFKMRGDLVYKSESAESLSLLMDALNKNDAYDRVIFSMSSYKECQ